MKGVSLPIAILAVIVMGMDFRAEGFPKPQEEPEEEEESDDGDFTIVDGFAFDESPSRDNPISRPDEPQIGRNLPTTVATTAAVAVAPVTQSPIIAECIKGCQVTGEYNPVCGSDNIVYNNPGMLTCAQRCGKSIQLARFGPCTSKLRG